MQSDPSNELLKAQAHRQSGPKTGMPSAKQIHGQSEPSRVLSNRSNGNGLWVH